MILIAASSCSRGVDSVDKTSETATAVSTRSTLPPGVEALRQERVTALESALDSRDGTTLQPFLAPNLQPDSGRIANEAVPTGATVHMDLATLEPVGAGLSQVEGTLNVEGKETTFLFLFSLDHDQWVLVGTTPKDTLS